MTPEVPPAGCEEMDTDRCSEESNHEDVDRELLRGDSQGDQHLDFYGSRDVDNDHLPSHEDDDRNDAAEGDAYSFVPSPVRENPSEIRPETAPLNYQDNPNGEATFRSSTSTGASSRGAKAAKSKSKRLRWIRNQWRRLRDAQKHLILDTWFIEISSWAFAAGCYAGLIVVLAWSNGKVLPHWPYKITINTLVTLFSTLTHMGLAIPVSSGISQLKWLWFTKSSRNAVDLETYDTASRGFFGSPGLIWTSRFRPIPTLGAVITALLLGTSPVTQQSVDYVSCLANDTSSITAYSPRSEQFNAFQSIGGSIGEDISINQTTEAAIYSGMLFGKLTYPHLDPVCPTGNCTWSEYKTLGMCPSLADVSDRLSIICEEDEFGVSGSCNATLPNGVSLIDTHSTAFATWAIRSTGPRMLNANEQDFNSRNISSEAFTDIEGISVADFFVLWQALNASGDPIGIRAVEVNLRYCVLTLASSVVNGQSMTKVVDWYTNFELDGNPDFGVLAATPPGSDRFTVTQPLMSSLFNYMSYQFTGTWTVSPDGSNGGFPTIGIKAVISAVNYPPYNTAGLAMLANNMAISLTNNIRSFNDTGAPAQGQAKSLQTYVHIRWPWLTLISFLLISTLVFLILVMWSNRRNHNELWRSSNLALLQAFDVQRRPAALRDIRSNQVMQKQAEIAKVKLERHRDGWRLFPD